MTDKLIRIVQYEQAADEKVSIGGIKWLQKWDVCVQCDSREEAQEVRLWFIKKAKIKAWNERDLTQCHCDHNEYCNHCFPPDFRKGGYWEQQEDKAQGDNND